MNNKKGYCVKRAFENLNRAASTYRIRESITRMEQDSVRDRIRDIEYHKTMRLLDLTTRHRNKEK